MKIQVHQQVEGDISNKWPKKIIGNVPNRLPNKESIEIKR